MSCTHPNSPYEPLGIVALAVKAIPALVVPSARPTWVPPSKHVTFPVTLSFAPVSVVIVPLVTGVTFTLVGPSTLNFAVTLPCRAQFDGPSTQPLLR